ncbi:MAG TPA: hypothetical protein DIW81_25730 [Planctomycetaceae bacterium]|nr:hypothetical protein [Rubinisphaera sp.]HCS54946.1 hypothetical protein [Planctomycetaceae bacterium]|tara:strand:+ start:635 stop:1009 length:375 start_codon:yes stop_codon:yes gene_type:complete
MFLNWAFVAIFVCVLVLSSFKIVDPNASTRATVESILLAESTPEKKLEELEPYIAIGEHISAVHSRIAPEPKEEFHIDRPTEHAYGLRDSNLVLAIRANGTIAGIGRHKHGTDDGTVWLAQPKW